MTIKSILRRSFINPFSIILISLAAISFVTDVLFVSNFSRNFSTFIILLTMYLVSAAIRLVQELKSKRTADFLAALVETDITVWRDGQWGQTSSTTSILITVSTALTIISSTRFSFAEFHFCSAAYLDAFP